MASSNMIVAWRSGTTSRYESQWALIHKFTHLNGATFSDIMAMFDATPKAPWNERARNLDRLERLDNRRLAQAFEIPEPDIRLLISDTYNIGSKTCATLRYCPDCMKKGFHTAAFQMNSIEKCPLHDVDLETKCPACHFTIAYRLGANELSIPFGCKCGALLWPGITSHAWSRTLKSEEEEVFGRLLRWVDNIKIYDRRRQHGQWSGDFIYEWNMRGLACIEKIEGWDPQYFGADGRDVIQAEYDGDWTPAIKRSQPVTPINVGDGAPCGCDYAFSNWFNEHLARIYRQRVATVVTSVEKLLGRHRRCTHEVWLYRSATLMRNGYCLWGIAYRKWVDSLSRSHWVDSEYSYVNFGRDSLDPAWGIKSALTAIKGRPDTNGRMLEPSVLWLALEIFEVRLLCDFVSFVKETMEELSYLREDGRLKGKWGKLPVLKKSEPVIAYYPGGVSRPRVKSYLGFSLQTLAKYSRSGVGCNCK